MRRISLFMVTSLLAPLGCYFDDGGQCELFDEAAIANGLLNPDTGQCDYYNGGGSQNCEDYGRPVPLAEPDRAPVDWAQCFSQCTDLGEAQCLNTPGCRAGYVSSCPPNGLCEVEAWSFAQCWATAPSGPVQGSCEGLSAYECSRHDNCVARHVAAYGCAGRADCDPAFVDPLPNQVGGFLSCAAEPTAPQGCYSDDQCGPGTRCNANEVCLPNPNCADDGACDDVCWGQCVPDGGGAGTCTSSEILCDALPPECPAGTVPGILNGCWSGYCIPFDACDPPIDPGSCHEPVVCTAAEPKCPQGSVAGRANGCFTGFCIPVEQCETKVECESIESEQECQARADCTAKYEGKNCERGEQGWMCEEWNFQFCSSDGTGPEPERCCYAWQQPGFADVPACFEGASCCADGTWACNDGAGNSTCEDSGVVCMGPQPADNG